jgi:hypothetical protein
MGGVEVVSVAADSALIRRSGQFRLHGVVFKAGAAGKSCVGDGSSPTGIHRREARRDEDGEGRRIERQRSVGAT